MSSDLLAKVPPHSEEAEKSVIGSVLIDNEALIKIGELLTPEDFYFSSHRIIYEHIHDLSHAGKPIDFVTLAQHIEDKGQLEAVGGRPYLTDLTLEVPTSHNAYQYAMIVKTKSVFRKLVRSGQQITALGFDESRELNDVLSESEKQLFGVTQTFIKNRFAHIREILQERFDEFANLHDGDEQDLLKGVPTGFGSLDRLLSGMKPSDLVILAGRPSMGKTAFALNIVQNVALKAKRSVGVFSLEMSKEQLVDRMFASLMKVDSHKLKTGKLDDADFSRIALAMEEMSQASIYIDDSSDSSITELKSKARRLQMEKGLDLIVIDYLQLMSGNNPMNRVQEISEISRGLKSLARELRIPVIALSQLSRAVESRPSKVPMLSDLRESGSIEQDADIVLMIYREDYYEEDTDRQGITDIYVRKHRNGPVGKAELSFKKEQSLFIDIDRTHADVEY